MAKPANCIVVLINELNKPLLFSKDHNIHGKPHVITHEILNGTTTSGGKPISPVIGFISTEKRSGALYGTQYGFTMKYGKTRLSFGVCNPLRGKNNCFCKFDKSAKYVAEETDKQNQQQWSVMKGGITLSIKCNSSSGSSAYYVARAYKTHTHTK